MVYLSNDPALCLLEILVNLDLPVELLPNDYQLLCVNFSFEDETGIDQVIKHTTQVNIKMEDSQEIGDKWLTSCTSLLLSVPSVVIPESINLLLNPAHPLYDRIHVASSRKFEFDNRLFIRRQ